MSNAEAQARWRAKNLDKARSSVKASLNKIRFGGNREVVLKRDNYSCVTCGMSDIEHREKFGRSITVDHIDGHGRNSKIKNHHITNLVTLCLPCHGRKDVLLLRHKKEVK